MNTRIIAISLIIIFSLGLILILFKLSNASAIQRNEFTRVYAENALSPYDTLNIKYNTFYIAGSTNKTVYLGNSSLSTYIFKYNIVSRDSQHFLLTEGTSRDLQSALLTIDSPIFTLQNMTKREIIEGNINNPTQIKESKINGFFDVAISISKTSKIIRTLKTDSKEYTLAKVSVNIDKTISKNDNILIKQIDGLFCTDGMLHYSAESGELIYLYYYRNEFIKIDTNLQIIQKCHTIDSNTHAKIKLSKIASQKSITMSAPPLVINKKSKIAADHLYILSPLLSKNESEKKFRAGSAIDVYNLTTCKYEYTFQIPNFADKHLTDFEIKNNKVICIFEDHLVIFKINTINI